MLTKAVPSTGPVLGLCPVYAPLTLTLFRRPEASDEEFEADAQWVMRDLQAAKRLLEAP